MTALGAQREGQNAIDRLVSQTSRESPRLRPHNHSDAFNFAIVHLAGLTNRA